jgi:hypothetical protein
MKIFYMMKSSVTRWYFLIFLWRLHLAVMGIDWGFTRRWCCFWPVGDSGFWRSVLLGCMVNFLLLSIVCNFARYVWCHFISLLFQSIWLYLLIVQVTCCRDIVTRTPNSCTVHQLEFLGTSHMSYHIHLFSFLLILVTHFSCHVLCSSNIYPMIFFISDAKCWELG